MGGPDHFDQFGVAVRRAAGQLATAFQPVLPFLLQAAASTGAYTAGLAAAQGVGMALRISSSMPVAGPLGGVLGVGLASALAGQAALRSRAWTHEGRSPLAPPLRTVRAEDLLVDAVLGIALFRVMGGRFRSVMPSDLARVGAIARESLPAAGIEYATEAHKRELVRLFRRDGCHHCGNRKGQIIGDHMPPNKHVKQAQAAAAARHSFFRLPFVRRAADALGVPIRPPRQRFYPQCGRCSQLQAAAIRSGKTKLVVHEVLHRGGASSAWHYAGTLVGLRHYHGSSSIGSGSISGGSNGRARGRGRVG